MPPAIPEWLGAGLLGILGTALLAGGAVVGHLLSAKASKRAAAVQTEEARVRAEEVKASRENNLIDQLQEELTAYRKEQGDRMTAQETRMTDLEKRNDELRTQNDGYRDLLHKHRAHIYDGSPPPPPEWPDHLPR